LGRGALENIINFFDVIGEIFSGLLPSGPLSVAKRTFLTFLLGAVSLGASIFSTYYLFASGHPYNEPEWAFNIVFISAMGGIISFVVGLAHWSKADHARLLPALASLFGLGALLLFPLCLLFGS